MKTTLDCPCGAKIVGKEKDELVEKVKQHLAEHGREYTREQILSMAY